MLSRFKKSFKKQDMQGSFIKVMYRPLGYYLAEKLSKTQVTPNQVTFVSFILFCISALFFSYGNHLNLIIGAIIFQLAYLLDYVDGSLARILNKGTNYGRWVDNAVGRLGSIIVFF